jgi:monoamine oxidase
MGHVLRVLLVFDHAVSEVVGDACPSGFGGFLSAPGRRPGVFWTLAPVTDRVLVAWAGGGQARGLPRDREELVRLSVSVLVEDGGVSRQAIDRSLVASFWHDWADDPWSRGAYAYPVVGGEGAPERLAEPVDDTLFLAGEATCGEQIGTVEGALASGMRAARRVIERLGRAGA